jgi:hypothetical protein
MMGAKAHMHPRFTLISACLVVIRSTGSNRRGVSAFLPEDEGRSIFCSATVFYGFRILILKKKRWRTPRTKKEAREGNACVSNHTTSFPVVTARWHR